MREKQLLSTVGENGGKGNLKQASNSRGHLKRVFPCSQQILISGIWKQEMRIS